MIKQQSSMYVRTTIFVKWCLLTRFALHSLPSWAQWTQSILVPPHPAADEIVSNPRALVLLCLGRYSHFIYVNVTCSLEKLFEVRFGLRNRDPITDVGTPFTSAPTKLATSPKSRAIAGIPMDGCDWLLYLIRPIRMHRQPKLLLR